MADPQFTEFVRKPFVVEAIEITRDNIEELAEHIGVFRVKDDGTPYISVNRLLIQNVYRVYPGFWMTRMGDNIRCYSRKIFRDQFVAKTIEAETCLAYFKGAKQVEVSSEEEIDA